MEKSLKAANSVTLAGVVVVDALVLAALSAGGQLVDPASWSSAFAVKTALAAIAPVVVLLLGVWAAEGSP